MWIMLIETTASARVTGQTGAEASSASGGLRFASAACTAWATMLRRAWASGSVGCHVRWGRADAKWIACSPVPLAISSMVPAAGSTSRRTLRIGSRLRATAGAVRALSDGAIIPSPDLPQVSAFDQHLHPLAGLVLKAAARLVEPGRCLAGLHTQRLHHLIAVIGHFEAVVRHRPAHV